MASSNMPADQKHRGDLRQEISQAFQNVFPSCQSSNKDDSAVSWEKLQDIEEHRREILKRTDQPFWKILSYWDGTVLQTILYDSVLLWIVLGLYIFIRLQAHFYHLPGQVEDVELIDIAVLGGFLSFFLVFFASQNYTRFYNQYARSMACEGRIFDVATLAATYMPRAAAWRLVRYMNAAHALAYCGLSKAYPSQVFFEHLNKELGLLTEKEYQRMKRIGPDTGGSCYREMIVWCMHQVEKQSGNLDGHLAQQFRQQILDLRGAIGYLYDMAE